MIFRVKYVELNEVKETKVDANFFLTDSRNNLLFFDSLTEDALPKAMFVAGRWISVIRRTFDD